MTTSVGERIATWRRLRGMSQSDLAAATGVTRSAVAQWETDRAGQVRDNLSRIARALDVSLEALLHGDTVGVLSGDELALLRLYRESDAQGRSELLRLARRLARTGGTEPTPGSGV